MLQEKVLLLSIFLRVSNPETIRIGAIFDTESSINKRAFFLAIDKLNERIANERIIEGLVESIPRNDPFKALHATCNLLSNKVTGILTPSPTQIIQTICDNKDIPLLELKWSREPSNSINFYPNNNILSQLYKEVIRKWNFKRFVLLYENDESLVKMEELLNTHDNKESRMIIRQLDKYSNGNYRSVLKELWMEGFTHFVIDCSTEIIHEVLLQAQQVGLMTNKEYYILTDLNLQIVELTPFQYSETNFTGFRLFNPDSRKIRKFANFLFPGERYWKVPLEAALIFDAVSLFGQVLGKLPKNITTPSIDCNSLNTWQYGTTILNLIKGMKHHGLTGSIEFNNKGLRSGTILEIFELKEEGITKIANWSTSLGFNFNKIYPVRKLPEVDGSLVNKSFTIVTCLTEPYGMRKESSVPLFGNNRYEGFGIELIEELSKRLGFNYTFIIREDKNNGEYDETTGEWTGMIGDVISGKADLAITDLTITSERETAVDFTTNFMNLGISILYQKPKRAVPSFFSFADPFAIEVWGLMVAAFFGVSFALFILGRLSPSEWQNPYPCIEEPEFLVNQLSLRNCFWFMTGSIMQQGSEIAPVGFSTRMLAGVWWFFTLIMVSSYTANLAAFLTTENPDRAFSDVFELVQIAEKKGIAFGAKINGSTEKFFRDSKHIEEYQKIYRYMKKHEKEVMVKDNKLGVEKAEYGNYAFFMETTSIEYEIQRRCGLTSVGANLDEKGYGIAMRKNSSYRWALSTTILKLQEDGVMAKLKRKWWEEKRGGGLCPSEDEKPSEGTPLNLNNVSGVFWVTIIGTLVSLMLVFLEMLFHIFKKSIQQKKSFRRLLKDEIKFYFQTTAMTKPVINHVEKREKVVQF